jgi:hypothetical protein
VPLPELALSELLAEAPPPIPELVESPPLVAVAVFGGGVAVELVPSPPHEAAPTVVSANRASSEATVIRDVMEHAGCAGVESPVNTGDSRPHRRAPETSRVQRRILAGRRGRVPSPCN